MGTEKKETTQRTRGSSARDLKKKGAETKRMQSFKTRDERRTLVEAQALILQERIGEETKRGKIKRKSSREMKNKTKSKAKYATFYLGLKNRCPRPMLELQDKERREERSKGKGKKIITKEKSKRKREEKKTRKESVRAMLTWSSANLAGTLEEEKKKTKEEACEKPSSKKKKGRKNTHRKQSGWKKTKGKQKAREKQVKQEERQR